MTSSGEDGYARAHAVTGNAEFLRVDDDLALSEADTSENLERCLQIVGETTVICHDAIFGVRSSDRDAPRS